jgi:hypothetical protein
MRYIITSFIACLLLSGCSKDDAKDDSNVQVSVCVLKSLTVLPPDSTRRFRTEITNAVAEDEPLFTKTDITYYNQSTSAFKLNRDIRPLIKDFNASKGFVVVVNNEPVYYGLFHPGYLNSMTIALPVIDPILFFDNELKIGFVTVTGQNLEQYDKRNDPKLINALSAIGKLR